MDGPLNPWAIGLWCGGWGVEVDKTIYALAHALYSEADSISDIAMFPCSSKLIVSSFIVLLLQACGGDKQTPGHDVETVHRDALTIDAHADIEIPGQPSSYVGPDGLSQVAPAKMRSGGLDAVVMSIAVGPRSRTAEGYAQAREIAATELAAVQALAAEPGNNAIIATNPKNLLAANEQGQLVFILGMQNALIFGADLGYIDDLFDAGVRVFALTHMGHNDFADSSRPLFIAATGRREADAEHGGLSNLGVAAIRRINELGGVIDISQLSRLAALQVMEISTSPVIASHSNVQALTAVSRNLSDEEIDRIGETGGVIHVAPFRGYLFDSTNTQLDQAIRDARLAAGIAEDYLYPFELYWEIADAKVKATFLADVRELLDDINLDNMLDHVDYIANRIGVDHVGIGTDFNHGSGIQGYADASEAMNVTKGLLARGYSPSDIAKIWGANFLRVWQQSANPQ
jgi:membrane dipeptidase